MSLRTEQGPYFGDFGGRFVPESLVAALDELTAAWEEAKADPAFHAELDELHRSYTGRPSIVTGMTSAPSMRIRATFSAWRWVSSSPM